MDNIMKKEKYLFIAMFFFISGNVFSQFDTVDHRTIGYTFNTLSIEYQYRGNGPYPIYYFFGFDGYSEAIMWENTGDNNMAWVAKHFWTLQIRPKNGNPFTFGGGYPNANKYLPLYKYQFRNGTMNNFYIIDSYANDIMRDSYNIESKNNMVDISTRDISDGTMPPRFFTFYNTSNDYLLKLYLLNFFNGIDYILDREWIEKNRGITKADTESFTTVNVIENEYDLTDISHLLRYLTKRELSVFRNYMFARYGYAFKTKAWNDFFTEYYKTDYNGTRTNSEVMASMTEYEKVVLNLVIEIEQQEK
ncbi:hypothetical protein FACS189476_00750 [Spirochaetia bacterium]|nr:hypothetical protein FACS189476_00750 [Spirochaetia bacterium]